MKKRHGFRSLSVVIALAACIFVTKDISFAAIPVTPSLISPSNGSNVFGTVVQFRWSQVTDATNYYLQVATDSGFSNLVYMSEDDYNGIIVKVATDSGFSNLVYNGWVGNYMVLSHFK